MRAVSVIAARRVAHHVPGFVESVHGGDEPLAGTAAGRVSRRESYCRSHRGLRRGCKSGHRAVSATCMPAYLASAARAAFTAARTWSGAVPPGWLRLATEPSSVR